MAKTKKNYKEVLKKHLEEIKLPEEKLKSIKKHTEEITKKLRKEIKKRKIDADVFIGGSLAKNTILKKDLQDIDIFIRFDKVYSDSEISKYLKKIVDKIANKGKVKKIHGSRNYFQIKKNNLIFEIVPTTKISKPKNARNITDLSYFHVSYVSKNLKKNPVLTDEILLAKSFCYAHNCYGAESYINGFSGYALELLIIHYGSFLKFIREVSKKENKIIIDPENQYKPKKNVLTELNEAKLESPIILIDPTFKRRNAAAALSRETFEKFKKECKKFLKNPGEKFFELEKIDKEKWRKKGEKRGIEFLKVSAKTKKQAGDIAGSKLLKFYKLLERNIEKYFKIKDSKFEYPGKKKANFYFILKSRKKKVIKGPKLEDKKNCKRFKKEHNKTYKKKGRLYLDKKIDFNSKTYLKKFKKDNKKKMKDMDIIDLNIK